MDLLSLKRTVLTQLKIYTLLSIMENLIMWESRIVYSDILRIQKTSADYPDIIEKANSEQAF